MPAREPQKAVALLVKRPPAVRGELDGCSKPFVPVAPPSLRARSGYAAVRLRTAAAGLFVPSGPADKHGLNFKLNWRHPLALPACCALILATPCLAILAGYVWLGRWRQQRVDLSFNGRITGQIS